MRSTARWCCGLIALSVGRPSPALEGPVAAWSFDDRTCEDAAGGIQDAIDGNFAFLPEGVRGACLRFDGFTTRIRREAARAPDLSRGFTLQGWVALAAYSWNWTPILAQRAGEARGFSFGIDSTGRFGLHLAAGGRWTRCLGAGALPLRSWHHVAATYDPSSGVRLFLDGQPAGAFPAATSFDAAREADLLIGRNHEKMVPAHLVREWAAFPSWWSFDGLMDEIRIHDRALEAGAIRSFRESCGSPGAPPIPPRRFPDVSRGPRRFGAYPARLAYDEPWDALWQMAGEPDLVVRFDELPVHLVFWRGTRFSPCWVTENGKWMADQSLETGVWPEELRRRGGSGAVGCCEHMSDTQCRFSHVRIVENTDARAVVHWRYALVDAALRFAVYDEVGGRGQYGDERYYIYPDGVATRDVTGWLPEPEHRAHQETIFLSEPGTRPEDHCELEALTLVNLRGETKTYSWEDGCPTLDLESPVIQQVNLKSRFKPLIIVRPGSKMAAFKGEIRREFSRFPWWNHWPVARIASDGRYAMAPDQASHSSLSWISQPSGALLYGLSDKPAAELLPLAKSWIHPAALAVAGGSFSSDGYDPDQRAYRLRRLQPGGSLDIALTGSADSPVLNPAFVIRGWGEGEAALTIDGTPVPRGRDFRYGHRHTLDGTDLVVWTRLRSEKPVRLSFVSLR